jgi:hypothetical protein
VVGPAAERGTAGHLLQLEGPEAFEATYTWPPDDIPDDRRLKAWKLWAASQDPELTPIKRDTVRQLQGAVAAVQAHPEAGPLLGGAETEIPIVWKSPGGHLLKSKVDFFHAVDRVAGDLKFTLKTDQHGFSSSVADWLYHWQAAAYMDALAFCGLEADAWWWVAVRPEPPHLCEVWTLDDLDLTAARMDYQAAADLYYQCARTGHWPSTTGQVRRLSMKPWA